MVLDAEFYHVDYHKNEALMFKLIFPSFTKKQMIKHGFHMLHLASEWDCIDLVRRRKRTISESKKFFQVDIIKQLWFKPKGFYYSDEMQDFINRCVKSNSVNYLVHFSKFCETDWLNLECWVKIKWRWDYNILTVIKVLVTLITAKTLWSTFSKMNLNYLYKH